MRGEDRAEDPVGHVGLLGADLEPAAGRHRGRDLPQQAGVEGDVGEVERDPGAGHRGDLAHSAR